MCNPLHIVPMLRASMLLECHLAPLFKSVLPWRPAQGSPWALAWRFGRIAFTWLGQVADLEGANGLLTPGSSPFRCASIGLLLSNQAIRHRWPWLACHVDHALSLASLDGLGTLEIHKRQAIALQSANLLSIIFFSITFFKQLGKRQSQLAGM